MKSSQRWIFILSLLVLAMTWAALYIGPAATTPEILFQLRLPRVLLGLIVGAGLATAGTLFQGLLRNPLADPYILGTSSGASFGVLLAAILHWRSPVILYSLSLLFALGSIVVVYRIAETQGRTPVQTLILSGVVVSTFLNALVFLGFSLFQRESFSALFFLLGTLAEPDPLLLKISGSLILISLIAICFFGRDLNVLAQGDETARHLGIDPEKSKKILFILASVIVAASVAVAGMIGFIGLIVPHCLRLILGPDHRSLLPASALGGALMLIALDAGARTLAAPREIPVGVLAALCGTPFFIYLLRRKKGEMF